MRPCYPPPYEGCRTRILWRCYANNGRGWEVAGGADVYLAGIGAEHLVDRLRAAGLQVIRPVQWQVHR